MTGARLRLWAHACRPYFLCHQAQAGCARGGERVKQDQKWQRRNVQRKGGVGRCSVANGAMRLQASNGAGPIHPASLVVSFTRLVNRPSPAWIRRCRRHWLESLCAYYALDRFTDAMVTAAGTVAGTVAGTMTAETTVTVAETVYPTPPPDAPSRRGHLRFPNKDPNRTRRPHASIALENRCKVALSLARLGASLTLQPWLLTLSRSSPSHSSFP